MTSVDAHFVQELPRMPHWSVESKSNQAIDPHFGMMRYWTAIRQPRFLKPLRGEAAPDGVARALRNG